MMDQVAKLASALFTALVIAAAASLPAPVDSPLELAREQFDAGDYRQAATLLGGAVVRNAQDATLHYWLGRCYFELDDFDRSTTEFDRAIQLAPNSSEYHMWLGRAYGRKAERANIFSKFSTAKKTRQEFEQAVRLDPSNFAAQHDLIEFYLRAPGIVGGGDDKAWRQAEELKKLSPAEAYLAFGDYWMEKKKPQQAEEEYRKALEARPRRIDPYLDIANFYLQRNDPVRAEEAVEAAAKLGPNEPQLLYFRALVRIVAGNRLDEAERMLKTYIAKVPPRSDRPTPAEAHTWLGRLYEREGKRDAAIEQYRRAGQLDSHNQAAREALRRLGK